MRSEVQEAGVLSERERSVPSGRRIVLGFALFTTALLVSMACSSALLVALLFDTLAPSLGRDLEALRQNALTAVLAGSLAALFAALLFARLFLVPALRASEQARRRLEQNAERAEESARLKSEFLANMSHEIRTPMNGVMAMADLLARTALDARQLRYTEIIRTSARGLLAVLNDVLDFSKIDAGKYELAPRDFDLRLAVRDAVELLAPRAQEKGIELIYRIAPGVPSVVHADGDRFRQVLTNLLGNAVKFTERGEVVLQVTVAARDGSGVTLHCSIRDTGPGISEAGLAKLFQAFSQVDGASARKQEGTGLGLAICKRLTELMGGQIGATSAVGRGSTFWFTMSARAVQSVITTEVFATPRRALVVSESEALRGMLEDTVKALGVHYDGARGAGEALELLERAIMDETPFDLALVDAKLEGGSGAELVRSIAERALPVAVALLTDPANEAEYERVPSAVARLNKPVSEAELREFLLDALQRDGASREAADEDRISSPSEASGSVLAVDDNAINRAVAVELLTELGFQVDVANDGQEALEAVQQREYRALLMDCEMPTLDGYAAAREIRLWENAQGRPRMPILAVTAHAFAGERDKVLAAGMDDYLAKPIGRAELEEALNRLLSRRTSRSGIAAVTPEAIAAYRESSGVRTAQRPEDEPVRGAVEAVVEAGVVREPLSPENDVHPSPGDVANANASNAALLDPAVRRSPKLMKLFLELVPGQLATLAQAAKAQDVDALRRHAHKLKGSCASLGARTMAALCERLHAGEPNDIRARPDDIAALHRAYAETAALLRAELERAATKVG